MCIRDSAQRVKKELFESEGDYKDALVAHHVLMQAAGARSGGRERAPEVDRDRG